MPCVVVLSCIPVSGLWNAKNWSYPAVERLEALVSIIAPINFMEVSMVITAYLHTGIPLARRNQLVRENAVRTEVYIDLCNYSHLLTVSKSLSRSLLHTRHG